MLRVDGQPRSSILIDPPNGRVPGYTDAARARMAKAAEIRKTQGGEFDHPELRPLAERCITSFGNNAGPPMLPNYFYNNSYTIVQSKDTVVILTEMVHDARVVRMNGTHPPASMRKWFGDSIGRWEGDTLVIETTNFHPNHGFRGSWENLKVTERLSRKDARTHQLSLHRRGSDDVHRAVHRRAGVQRDGAGRDGLRVRVPRSQLRPRRRDERRARAGTRSGEEEDAAAVTVT